MKSTAKADVYEIITDRICAMLEQGCVPWRKPWHSAGGNALLPANWISRKVYRGINLFLLACSPYECPFWLTYRQASEVGGNVRKGEKGFPVVYWNWFPKRVDGKPIIGPDGKPEMVPFLRYYTVFNCEQCEGIDWRAAMPAKDESKGNEWQPFVACEAIVNGMPERPDIRHGGAQAYYSPAFDYVQMPKREDFADAAGYYATLFHELTHATGHAKRLARKGEKGEEWSAFGSQPYAREELVAEMGSAFLCAFGEISNPETLQNSAAYCANWLQKLRNDPRLIVTAAAQAQKAADYIRHVEHETEESETAHAVAAQ